MEHDPRPFQATDVQFINVARRADEYHPDSYKHPYVADYRNNLTALSQRYNLHFQAWSDHIAVYQPKLPNQDTENDPSLLIPPMLANGRAQGYLSHRRPGVSDHCINHLVVSDIGSAEVVAVVTDSGNVAAYYTKSILEAIQKEPYKFSTEGRSDVVGLRPFFTHWVYESAWGLAIHKESRMLAVSCNTPHHHDREDNTATITVFAFALEAEGDKGREDQNQHHMEIQEDDWILWNTQTSQGRIPRRNRNYKVELPGHLGHKTNVPSIAFVNTKDDAGGRGILTTDLSGDTKYWDIWTGTVVRSWHFAGHPLLDAWNPGFRIDGGWAITAIDPQAFITATTEEEFFGHDFCSTQTYGEYASYNLTNIVRNTIPGYSHTHPRLLPRDQAFHDTESDQPQEQAEHYADDESDLEERLNHRNQDGLGPRIPPIHEILAGSPPGRTPSLVAQESATTGEMRSNIRNDPILTVDEAAGIERDVKELNLVNSRTSRQDAFCHQEQSAPISEPATAEVNDESHVVDVDDEPAAAGYLEDDHNDEDNQELLRLISDETDDDDDDDDDDDEEFEADDDGYEDDALEHYHHQPSSPEETDDDESDSSSSHQSSAETEAASLLVTSPEPSDPDWASSGRKSPTDKPTRSKRPHTDIDTQQPDVIPNISILHCSFAHVRLVNPSARGPHIVCSNILSQDMDQWYEDIFGALARLNMVQVIPELGILLIASQLGRCAVCTLTKRVSDGTTGFRVDWVLPTRRQEQQGLRPRKAPLLGMAVGPIQGHWKAEDDGIQEDWTGDRTVEGVYTTFENRVLSLHPRSDGRPHDVFPSPKRSRRSAPLSQDQRGRRRDSSRSDSRSSSIASVEERRWPKSEKKTEAELVEGSRRFRLMLTYADLTVLTYELGREIRQR